MMNATYSPDDNKLRLYADGRLDTETYARVKAAGFRWAPQQKLFVAPMWTPDRADLLIDLCGDIEDEDSSLTDRAEERAERFEEYREKRKDDAERAHAAVSAIADNIPLGQPILVGHHSEKRARKDAERIENGMRRALKMWDTSKYWASRAAGAIRNAKYKERPDVRARRIKGLESDRRKFEKSIAASKATIGLWGQLNNDYKDMTPCDDALRLKRALHIANYYQHGLWSDLEKGAITPRAAQLVALKGHGRNIARCGRWLSHVNNRLTYERAMLAEAGGLITDRTEYPITTGGRVLVGDSWLVVFRINRKDGAIVSISTRGGRYARVVGIEEVKDYKPGTEEDCAAVDARRKLPPLCNYRSEGSIDMTSEEFKKRTRASDFAGIETIKGTDTTGPHRRRRVPGQPYWKTVSVFLTDQKRKDPPEPITTPLAPIVAQIEPTAVRPAYRAPEPTAFDGLRETLKAGVQVVSAPQLFPTPGPIAAQLVELADIQPGNRVLEPSAGTGALLGAMGGQMFGSDVKYGRVHAVEIAGALCPRLRADYPLTVIHQGDFLAMSAEDFGGTFDRIVMNPPFTHGADIKHILHARGMLSPTGKLVAICANGPRQRDQLEPLADAWIDLPAGSFEESGTGVNTAIVVLGQL